MEGKFVDSSFDEREMEIGFQLYVLSVFGFYSWQYLVVPRDLWNRMMIITESLRELEMSCLSVRYCIPSSNKSVNVRGILNSEDVMADEKKFPSVSNPPSKVRARKIWQYLSLSHTGRESRARQRLWHQIENWAHIQKIPARRAIVYILRQLRSRLDSRLFVCIALFL